MKLKSMTSVITKSALVLATCASLNAFAGTSAPAKGYVAPQPEPDGALFDTLGASVEVGYDTRYYFRGLYRADNTVSAGINLSVPLTEQVSLGLGARYISTVETTAATPGPFGQGDFDFSELALSTGLNYDAGFATLGLVFNHYEYFDGFSGTNGGIQAPNSGEFNVSSAQEVGLTAATSLGPVNVYAGWYYDFRIGGSYAEVGADLPIEITSWLSIVPGFRTGYGFDYYTLPQNGSRAGGWTHVIPTISMPIKLTKSATLTPYVAYNISLDSRHDAAKGSSTGLAGAFPTGINANDQDTEFFGGVRLSVSF
ncbi:MAG TPA: hypothetical protein DIT13_01225 [Verrucomicrobiales bacterium]|nr:hypothetical protein [Verrucomicrobiales bacterium]HRJ09829.1 hypothetical protein [Prosthecobacter sp.]HRK14730.1 hypothetical protein [Prosthecobacter sp.]